MQEIEKLMVAVPCTDYMHWKFTESLAKLIKQLTADYNSTELYIAGGTLVYLARDKIAREALWRKCSHILWLDSDMVYPPDIVKKLAEVDADLVSGVYVSRHMGNNPVLFESLDPDRRYYEIPKEPFPIEGCGFGCVLTKTDIFRFLFGKYFSCFVPNTRYGEDLAFCQKASEAGYSMFATPKVQVGHISIEGVWPSGERETY